MFFYILLIVSRLKWFASFGDLGKRVHAYRCPVSLLEQTSELGITASLFFIIYIGT